jgi:predicted secreted Zn-dependent protease
MAGVGLSVWAAEPDVARAQADRNGIPKGVHVDVQYEYYDVTGRTSEEVLNSLMTAAPRDENEVYHGLTKSSTRFFYEKHYTSQYCRLVNPGVRADVVVVLPRWSARAAPPTLKEAWSKFLSNLERHEEWHVSATRTAAKEMFDVLQGLESKTCGELDRKARRLVDRVSERINRHNEDYDRTTDHGRKEGVVWPVENR